MLTEEHRFSPELSPSPNLIFVDASFSILSPSQKFSLQLCKQESSLAYRPLSQEPQTQQIVAEKSQTKKSKPKIKFKPRVEFLVTIYDIKQQANERQQPFAWVMLQGFFNSEDLVWPIGFRFPGLNQQVSNEPRSLPQLLNQFRFRSLFSDQAEATSHNLSMLISERLPFVFSAHDVMKIEVLAFTSYEFEKYWFAGFDIEPLGEVDELKCDYGRLKRFHYASLFGRKMDSWVGRGAKSAYPIFHVDACLEHRSTFLQPVFRFPVSLSDCEKMFSCLSSFWKASGALVLVLRDEDCLCEESLSYLKKIAGQNGIKCINFTQALFNPVIRELLALTSGETKGLLGFSTCY